MKAEETSKNILILTYWSFKEGLIQTYTLPYLYIILQKIPAGSKVYLFTLEKDNLKFSKKELKEKKNELQKQGIIWLPHQYFSFGLKGGIKWGLIIPKLVALVMYKKVGYIHAFCTPPGMIGYILACITGSQLILDSYEPHAEAMVENKEWAPGSFSFRLLFKFEKWQTRKATYVISATRGMENYALEKYGKKPVNFYIKPACVNLDLFKEENKKNKVLLQELELESKTVCVYAGKFGGIYLGQEIFDFFSVCYQYWQGKFKVLILTNHSMEEINLYCDRSCLPREAVHSKFVMHNEIPIYMGLGDFAVTPVKPIPTKRFCTPIKDGEYWALGLPVVITSNISDDSQIIEDNKIGAVLKDFRPEDYILAVQKIDSLLKKYSKEELYQKIRKIAVQYRSFEIADKVYQEVYG